MRRATAVISLVASTAWTAPAGLQSTTLGRGPTLVMIHTVGESRTVWLPTARKLLGRYRVVLVDLPGHGESPMPDPFSLQAGAALIDEVLAAQKSESTVVVGHSTGGLMALMALSAHPGRARGLIGIEMPLKNSFAIPEQQRENYLAFIDSNYDLMLKRIFMSLGRDSLQQLAIYAQASQVPGANMRAYLRELVMLDPSAMAKPVKMPLMFVGTERLWPADKDSAAFVGLMGYAPMGSFSVRRLSKCGFMVASEQPDSLAAILSDFAQRALSAR